MNESQNDDGFLRFMITTSEDKNGQLLELRVPKNMVEAVRRAIASRVVAEIDWISGYEGESDSDYNQMELGASMNERRKLLGLDD